jgi:hypothetical protein
METEKVSDQAVQDSVEPVEDKVENQSAKDQVSYETYKKVLAEAKKAKAAKAEYEAELQKLKQVELEQKGQDKQLIESLRKQLADKDMSERKMKEHYAFNSFKNSVAALGAKHGCVDNEILLKSVDINSIEMNDDFTFNEADLEREIAQLASKKSYLFQKKVPKVADAKPVMPKAENKKMSIDDMAKALAMLNNNKN